MNKILSEFKTFVNRGNVVDLAVGVMIGSAFTAMVNGLSNYILKPVINYLAARIMGDDSTAVMHTYLTKVMDEEGNVDLASSIYIDWSAFISAVINFAIIAVVLFLIVKIINKLREEHKEFSEKLAKTTLDREERRELRAAGVKCRDKAAVAAYFKEKERLAAEKTEADKRAAEEAEKRRREENPTQEELLKDILMEMRKKR